MIHVDWLQVSEVMPEGTPFIGKNLVVFCSLDGTYNGQRVNAYRHEGSHDDSLFISCDGVTLRMSGNPSKIGRWESLFGFGSVLDALRSFNSLLRTLGHPTFSESGYYSTHQEGRNRLVTEVSSTCHVVGPKIERLDLTENWRVVDGSVRDLILWLGGQSQVRSRRTVSPLAYGSGETVAWGSSEGLVYSKAYAKGLELTKRLSKYPLDSEPRKFLSRVADFSSDLLRWEVTVRSKYLSRHGLQSPFVWESEVMKKVFMENRVSLPEITSIDWRADLIESFVASGLSEREASFARNLVLAWAAGADPRDGIALRTYQKYRKVIRFCGIDLDSPVDIQRLPIRVREVSCCPLEASDIPDWYWDQVA